MKRAKVLLVTLVFGVVGFGMFVPLESCGCLTPAMEVESIVDSANRVIKEYYEQYGVYPSLETLRMESSLPILPWSDDHEDRELYYKTENDGQEYVLAGYVKQKTLFGRSVLKEVSFASK